MLTSQGLPPTFTDSTNPERTTKWRPYVMYETSAGKCDWGNLDWAIFEDSLPDAIRQQLR